MRKDRTFKVLLVLAVLAVAGYFAYHLVSGWYRDRLEAAKTEERLQWQQRTEELVNKVSELEGELQGLKGEMPPEEKVAEALGREPGAPQAGAEAGNAASAGPGNSGPSNAPGQLAPEEIERQILAFFAYLDEQPYVRAYQLEGGTYHQYALAVEKLSQQRPRISGEQESLYTMARNVAHFYRSLGKDQVALIREVIRRENEIIEPVMRTFYLWFTSEYGAAAKIKGRPELPTMYQYAGFLVNTLGGRSYLMRRDPKVRTLTYYYCVLILDRANDAGLNADGIDIRPHLRAVYADIRNQAGLAYQKHYLSELEKLLAKYKM